MFSVLGTTHKLRRLSAFGHVINGNRAVIETGRDQIWIITVKVQAHHTTLGCVDQLGK